MTWWRERQARKQGFYQSEERPPVERKLPCDPLVEHPKYICSANGQYQLDRLPEDNGNLQERYEREHQQWDMTGVTCPADAYTRTREYQPYDFREPPPKPKVHLSASQVAHAREVLAKWQRWEQEGWPERFNKRVRPEPPRLTA